MDFYEGKGVMHAVSWLISAFLVNQHISPSQTEKKQRKQKRKKKYTKNIKKLLGATIKIQKDNFDQRSV